MSEDLLLEIQNSKGTTQLHAHISDIYRLFSVHSQSIVSCAFAAFG